MIQKIIYKLHEKWREFRLPIITIEGLKDKAVLLRLLINYFIKGSGTTHVRITTHTTQNTKEKRKVIRGEWRVGVNTGRE